jgi:ABC-type proline/glycine betaine transport system permease subunit
MGGMPVAIIIFCLVCLFAYRIRKLPEAIRTILLVLGLLSGWFALFEIISYLEANPYLAAIPITLGLGYWYWWRKKKRTTDSTSS